MPRANMNRVFDALYSRLSAPCLPRKRSPDETFHRIEHFIEVFEHWPRNPDHWESEHVLQAVRALEELDFARAFDDEG